MYMCGGVGFLAFQRSQLLIPSFWGPTSSELQVSTYQTAPRLLVYHVPVSKSVKVGLLEHTEVNFVDCNDTDRPGDVVDETKLSKEGARG